MNSLSAANQAYSNMQQIHGVHRTNRGHTQRQLQVVEAKTERVVQRSVDEAINVMRQSSSIKGQMVDLMA